MQANKVTACASLLLQAIASLCLHHATRAVVDMVCVLHVPRFTHLPDTDMFDVVTSLKLLLCS